MRVILKVTRGSNAGKEISVPASRFLIGRGTDCHLRPQSDAISRRHCEVTVGDASVTVRDFGSRNGTHVNGQRVEGEHELKMGDLLRMGPLEFEVFIDHSLGGTKRPQVQSVKEATERTAESGSKADSGIDDSDISSWLEEEDEADRVRRLADPETRQYKLSETDQIKLGEAAVDKGKDDKKKKKKKPGKLPERPKDVSKDSKIAAEKALRQFFNRDADAGS